MNLRRVHATILDARAFFDTELEDYPKLSNRMDPRARIVLSTLVDFWLLKTQDAYEEGLTSGERKLAVRLLLKRADTAEFDKRLTYIIKRNTRRLKSNRGRRQDLFYADARFLLPTLNLRQRFFFLIQALLKEVAAEDNFQIFLKHNFFCAWTATAVIFKMWSIE